MPENYGQEPQYRTLRLREFGGGVRDDVAPTKLDEGESPSAQNIEFDRGSIATTRGSRKFNNQTAPLTALRTRVDKSLSPLFIEAGKSVPLRGYGYIPFAPEYDLGGDFAVEAP
jgi:hypothetical protein